MKHRFSQAFRSHIPFIIFFVTYLIIGLFIYPDYGVSIDEYSQIDIGRVNYERLRGSVEIQSHYDRYYGPAFEVPLYLFSHTLSAYKGIDEIRARHLGNFLFFAVTMIPWYLLLWGIFGSPFYGLLGSVLLVASPRMFAESFYNTKDIAFLAASVWVLFAFHRYTFRPTTGRLLALSVVTGFAFSIRVQGLFLFWVMIAGLLIPSKRMRYPIWHVPLYAVAAVATAWLLFPVFWNDPIRNLVGFWQNSAHPLGPPTLFSGRWYVSPSIPWQYHMVWIAITSPISVVVAAIAGAAAFIRSLGVRSFVSDTPGRQLLVSLCVIVGTFGITIFFHPRIYDGWRHVYYVYPSIVCFAVYAVWRFRNAAPGTVLRLASGIILAGFIFDGVGLIRSIVRNHPYQYVYFNGLAGGYQRARANFDFDYWGISQKQLFEYLREKPFPRGSTYFISQELPYTERVIIPLLNGKGMRRVDVPEDADIYIAVYRDHRDIPKPPFKKLYAPEVDGAELSAVYSKL